MLKFNIQIILKWQNESLIQIIFKLIQLTNSLLKSGHWKACNNNEFCTHERENIVYISLMWIQFSPQYEVMCLKMLGTS